LIAFCGQLSQFSLLGRKHDMKIFSNGLYSFFESMLVGGIVFTIMNFGLHSSDATFYALLTWSATLLVETISVAHNNKSLFNIIFSKLGIFTLRDLFTKKDESETEALIKNYKANGKGYNRYLIGLLEAIIVLLGYSGPNALLYFNSLLTTMVYG